LGISSECVVLDKDGNCIKDLGGSTLEEVNALLPEAGDVGRLTGREEM
jgi:hypothetical protein